MGLDFFQAHRQCLLKILIKAIVDAGVTGLHGRGTASLVGVGGRSVEGWVGDLVAFVGELSITAIIDSNWGKDAQVREGDGLA